MTSWIPTYVMITAGLLLTGSAIVWVLQQRRSPQSALAWILFIVMVPYLGVPLFFTLGVRKGGARYEPVTFSREAEAPPLHPLEDQLRRLGVPAASLGNAFSLEVAPETARAALETLVESAETRLDITLYRLDPDEIGRDFTGRLIRAIERGVEVRMILDQIGTWRRPRRALKAFRAAGGKLRVFSPFPNLAATGRMNLRNHRKMVIADGRAVWSGGRNVGGAYLGASTDPATWRDLSFTLKGPAVRRFCEVFAADWEKEAAGTAGDLSCASCGAPGSTTAQLVPSGPDLRLDGLHDSLIHAIHTARERIWIATPYFLPTDQLLHALATAARLGRDVRILVPARSNQRLADFARGAYLRELDEAGCRILRFTGGMMHAKGFVIDDVAWVGSANLDIRSMLLNFETTLMLYDPASVAELANWFAGLEAGCETGARPAGLLRRLAEASFRLGAPIL